MDVALPAIHLPELPQGSRRLYLCSILNNNNNNDNNSEPWNVADCLRQVRLDVVASSHLQDAEETADVIHRSSAIAGQEDDDEQRHIPMRIVSPRLGTSDRYVTGLQQILRDFATAHHVCVVQHQDLLQDTPLWRELCVLQGAAQTTMAGVSSSSSNGDVAGNSSTTCCRIHVLDHQVCDVLGDKWTLQMCNFCCALNEWQ